MEASANSRYAFLAVSDTATPAPDHDMSSTRSLFSLSLPRLPRHRGHHKSLTRVKFADLPISELEEVEKLNAWGGNSPQEKRAEPTTGFEKVQMYRGRFSDLDRIVARRKAKSLFPPISLKRASNADIVWQQISASRTQKISQEVDQREKTKYSKVYEEELAASYATLQTSFSALQTEREAVRDVNTDLNAKLQAILLQLRQDKQETQPPLAKDIKKVALIPVARSKKVLTPKVKPTNEPEPKSVNRELEAEKTKILNDIEENLKKAREIDNEVKLIKVKLRDVREAQARHYFSILAEGTDTRSEGLSWVLKALWKLNQRIRPESFPAFLDPQTVEVITIVAEKSREADALSSLVSIEDLNRRRNSIVARLHPDRWNGVRDRLKLLGKKIYAKGNTGREEVVEGEIDAGDERLKDVVEKVQEGEEQERALRREIRTLQEEEVKRLIHECCFNKLEQTLGASLKQMLSALLGSEVINRQMSTIAKEQKSLIEELEKTKTYCFGPGRK